MTSGNHSLTAAHLKAGSSVVVARPIALKMVPSLEPPPPTRTTLSSAHPEITVISNLELEFKVHPQLNSGIQIRSLSLPGHRNGRVHGYQVEIDPSNRSFTAGIYDEARRGWLQDLSENRAARFAFKQDAWNRLRVEAIGDHIRTWINDIPAADLIDSMTGFRIHCTSGSRRGQSPRPN